MSGKWQSATCNNWDSLFSSIECQQTESHHHLRILFWLLPIQKSDFFLLPFWVGGFPDPIFAWNSKLWLRSTPKPSLRGAAANPTCHFHDLQGFVTPGWRIPRNTPNLFLLSNGWQARCGCLRASGSLAGSCIQLEVEITHVYIYIYTSYVLILLWRMMNYTTRGCYLLFLHISQYQYISTSPDVPHLTILTHTHKKKQKHTLKIIEYHYSHYSTTFKK